MHYCMYCNTQASESFLSPHIGRFLWFCHLVWSKTVVSPSVYTSLQWRKNETHIISMAPSLGISQGCKSILKQSNLRGVFFTFSFCNTWIIKKRLMLKDRHSKSTKMEAPLPIPGHSRRTKDRANPDLPQQLLMKKLPVRPNAVGQSRELKGLSYKLERCSIRKSSIYTQEVECRQLIEYSRSTLLPTPSSRGLSVEAELMNAQSGRKFKSTSYLTWLNKLYEICS